MTPDNDDASGVRPERRSHGRKPATGHGQLIHRRDEIVCDLIDLSFSGARVACPNGLVPRLGEDVEVRLLDGSTIAGRVAWISLQEIGIAFAGLEPDIHDRSDAVSQGAGQFRRIICLQILRQGG